MGKTSTPIFSSWRVAFIPSFSPIGDKIEEGWEGCLSVPGMRGLVVSDAPELLPPEAAVVLEELPGWLELAGFGDVVTANADTNTVSVLLGTGTGSFAVEAANALLENRNWLSGYPAGPA